MPQTDGSFYDMPYVGQPFYRKETSDRYEYGQVGGIVVTGHFIRSDGERVPDWSASIDTGFNSQHRFDCRKRMTDLGWRPVESAEMDKRYGPGFLALRERVEALEESVGRVREAAALADDTIAAEVGNLQEDVAALSGAISGLTSTPAPSQPPPAQNSAEGVVDGRRRRRLE